MIEADPPEDPAQDWDVVREDPPNPTRFLKQRLDACEKAAKAWEERCVLAEGRLSAANAQTRLWQRKYDEALARAGDA